MGSAIGMVPAQAVSVAQLVEADAIFTARAVTKVYEMGEVRVEALRGVDFDLHEREFVVLLVEIGHQTGREAEVLGGLTESERVIVHPSDAVLDGTRVRD